MKECKHEVAIEQTFFAVSTYCKICGKILDVKKIDFDLKTSETCNNDNKECGIILHG